MCVCWGRWRWEGAKNGNKEEGGGGGNDKIRGMRGRSENKADGKKEGRTSREEEKWFDGSLMNGQQRWMNYSCQIIEIQASEATSFTPPTPSCSLELPLQRSESELRPSLSLVIGLMGFSKDGTCIKQKKIKREGVEEKEEKKAAERGMKRCRLQPGGVFF